MAESNTSVGPDKVKVVSSICRFLTEEIGRCLSLDVQESLTVAVQCLEAAYGIDDETKANTADIPNLWNALIPVGDKAIAEAEMHKDKGNELMSKDCCKEAVDSYTRAIELNPQNPVYYCNRAAAHCHLENYTESVADCQEAVKLDAKYSKAYARLGFTYLSMKLHAEAAGAYSTAVRLDPANVMYRRNFETAMNRFRAEKSQGRTPPVVNIPPPEDLALDPLLAMTTPEIETVANELANNPDRHRVMASMLGDETLRNALVNLIHMRQQAVGNPELENMIFIGEQLAHQVHNERRGLAQHARRSSARGRSTNQSGSSSSGKKKDKNRPSEPPGNA